MVNALNEKNRLVLTSNLKEYFFETISEFNKKSLAPIPVEAILYTSSVLDYYMSPEKMFEFTESGKVRSKILGIKLLEAVTQSKEDQKKIYKDVGDSALVLCGVFNQSINRKILDINYYYHLGSQAYSQLNCFEPSVYDYPKFFDMLASSFEGLTLLVSKTINLKTTENTIINIFDEKLTEREMILLGMNPVKSKISN